MTLLGFTRPSSKLEASVREAEAMGFRVLAAPSLDVEMGDDSEFSRMEDAIPRSAVAIFGSTTAADICSKRYGGRFPELFSGTEVLAIGSSTAKRLESFGVRVSAVPEEFSSYGLVDMLGGSVEGRTVLMVRSDSGTDVLSKGIVAAGAELVDIAVYRLRDAGMTDMMSRLLDAIGDGSMDWMAFTSPMSAETFFGHVGECFGDDNVLRLMEGVEVAAIGRPTAERLESLGRKPDLIPEHATFHDILLGIKERSR